MAVRTAYVPVAGTAITASNHIKFPGGWIGYAEVTAGQTGISGDTALTSLTVTVTVGTTRRLLINGNARCDQKTASGATSQLTIRENTTAVGQSTFTNDANYSMQHSPMTVRTPSSGSNTYHLTLLTTGGTVDMVASGASPASILVQDIGPAS